MAIGTLKQAERKISAQDLEIGRIRKELRLLRERISSVTGASSPETVFGTSSLAGIVTAGAGLTGGGTLPGTVTFNVGAGDGIVVFADAVAVDLASPSGLEFSSGDLQIADSLAGDGLTISSKVMAVNAGDGLAITTDAVHVDLVTDSGMQFSGGDLTLGTPTTLTTLTINNVVAASHSHEIQHSSNPGANARILSSTAAGYLQLVRLGVGVAPSYPLHSLSGSGAQARFAYDAGNYADVTVTGSGVLGLWPSAGELALHYDGSNYSRLIENSDGTLDIYPVSSGSLDTAVTIYYDQDNYADLEIGSGGNFTIQPTGDLILNPLGNDVRPLNNYDVNLGTPTAMWLSLHAAELWVQYLIASYTMATIGGRVLVGPTTYLTEDMSGDEVTVQNPGFENRTGNNFDDWTEAPGGGTVTAETSDVYDGSVSVRLVNGASASRTVIRTESGSVLSVTPGTTYVVTFYSHGDGDWAGDFMVWDDDNNIQLVPWQSTNNASTAYRRVAKEFTPGPGCTNILIYLSTTTVAYASAYFDSVAVYPAEMVTEHNNLSAGDNFHLEYGGFIEFCRVLDGPTGSGPYTYAVDRNRDGTGINAWPTGRAVFNTGVQGSGFIDMYSVEGVLTGYGPTIVGNVRYGDGFNEWTPFWAIGNLENLYDYASEVYGAAFGRYLSGHTWMSIDATNGIRIMSYNTILAQWDMTGDIIIGQTGVGQSNVYISSDAIQLRTGAFVNIELKATGDATFGNVTDNQGNVYWNNTNKRVEFRGGVGGTSVQLYIDTDGSLVGGGGSVSFNESGIIIDASGTEEYLRLNAGATGGLAFKLYNTLDLEAEILADNEFRINLGSSAILGHGTFKVSHIDTPGSTTYDMFTVDKTNWIAMTQGKTAGALPVLTLEQLDVDEPFLKFIGTADSANLTRSLVDAGDVSTATAIGFAKVEIRDDGNQIADGDGFILIYSIAP